MSKWKILHGAGDVAVYNGLKKIFHVFPEEAKIVCDILNELEDEVERLKAERQEWADLCIRKESDLDRCKAEPIKFYDWLHREGYEFGNKAHYAYLGGKHYIITDLIKKFRASQQTQEGKG